MPAEATVWCIKLRLWEITRKIAATVVVCSWGIRIRFVLSFVLVRLHVFLTSNIFGLVRGDLGVSFCTVSVCQIQLSLNHRSILKNQFLKA